MTEPQPDKGDSKDTGESKNTFAYVFNNLEEFSKSQNTNQDNATAEPEQPESENKDRDSRSDDAHDHRKQSTNSAPDDNPIVKELIAKNYHPVLIFGTPSSGKSILILSLLSYLNFELDSPGNCHFGEEIFSEEHLEGFEDWMKMNNDAAKDIYDNALPDFFYGKLPEATRVMNPIFIPVEFVPKNGGRSFKIALMESQGEFFQIDLSGKKGSVDLKKEIKTIYKTYKRGISIIFIAPSRLSLDREFSVTEYNEMRKSDQSLYDCMRNYNQTRLNADKMRDRFLFVFSKWDSLLQKGSEDPDFLEPNDKMLSIEIRKKFGLSWAYFQKMPNKLTRNVMQYSVCVDDKGEILSVPEDKRKTYTTFPASLWNWLESHEKTEFNLGAKDRSWRSRLYAVLKS